MTTASPRAAVDGWRRAFPTDPFADDTGLQAILDSHLTGGRLEALRVSARAFARDVDRRGRPGGRPVRAAGPPARAGPLGRRSADRTESVSFDPTTTGGRRGVGQRPGGAVGDAGVGPTSRPRSSTCCRWRARPATPARRPAPSGWPGRSAGRPTPPSVTGSSRRWWTPTTPPRPAARSSSPRSRAGATSGPTSARPCRPGDGHLPGDRGEVVLLGGRRRPVLPDRPGVRAARRARGDSAASWCRGGRRRAQRVHAPAAQGQARAHGAWPPARSTSTARWPGPSGPVEHGFRTAVGIVLNTSRWMTAVGDAGMMRRACSRPRAYARHRRPSGSRSGRFRRCGGRWPTWSTAVGALHLVLALTGLEDRIDGGSPTDADVLVHRFLVNVAKYLGLGAGHRRGALGHRGARAATAPSRSSASCPGSTGTPSSTSRGRAATTCWWPRSSTTCRRLPILDVVGDRLDALASGGGRARTEIAGTDGPFASTPPAVPWTIPGSGRGTSAAWSTGSASLRGGPPSLVRGDRPRNTPRATEPRQLLGDRRGRHVASRARRRDLEAARASAHCAATSPDNRRPCAPTRRRLARNRPWRPTPSPSRSDRRR